MRGDGQRQAMADASAGGRASIHAIDDVTSVLGMPDGVLPAPVQARITALMEEVDACAPNSPRPAATRRCCATWPITIPRFRSSTAAPSCANSTA